jgi:serine/threonine protein phosphatase PrpC
MDKKSSIKKRKSTSIKESTASSTATPVQGPYRNIEESKKHQVTSFPDVKKVLLKPEHDFLIVACDGIWDCFTNE